jgi:hypothetical protein
MIKKAELCRQCGLAITLRPSGEDLLSFNSDGTLHHCGVIDKRPIGQAIVGQTIEAFTLKKRRATLTLSGNMVLEISARLDDDLVAMDMMLVTPDGVLSDTK